MTSIKKKICKIILILLIMQFIFAIENVSQAGIWTDIMSAADKFLGIGEFAYESDKITVNNGNGSGVTIISKKDYLQSTINDIYNILFPIAIIITVIMGVVLGIKFMLASAEDKAKLKESIIPYIAGCIVIYGAFGIWKLAIIAFSSIG